MISIVGQIPGFSDFNPEDEVLCFKAETTRRAVVQRDDDTLTPAQVDENWESVEKAMLEELLTWKKHQCFSRKPRAEARNIIDTKWVLKFKHEQASTDAQASTSTTTAQTKRVIRARLTVRGFKDRDRSTIDTYAGTSTRYSQKLICSEAVRQGWDIATTDISKAFLQGVTYEELAKKTGDAQREVNFYLPQRQIHILRKVPGFENVDANNEVLHCDKPGTGLVDAPRAFSMKLAEVTDKCGFVPSKIDPELCYKFNHGRLVCMMTKHVDDLKLAGDKKVVLEVMNELQKVFGELKITWNDFTNCGVRHSQNKVTK